MKSLKIAFLGDIMPGGILHNSNEKYISDSVINYLEQFDLRSATLESAIGDDFPFDEEKMKGRKSIVYSKNKDIEKLVYLGVNVVSLANNHIYDLGKIGLQNTINLLKKLDIKYFGAGMNISEASKPAIVEINGKSIAFLGYCSNSIGCGYLPIASDSNAGVAVLELSDYINQIKDAKKKNDFVFVIPHWGEEYTFFPLVECRKIAYSMIKAGADGVIGSHSHRIQSHISYKEKPVFFSLGNFLFPDRYLQPPRPTWYPNQAIDLDKLPITYGYPFVTEYTKKLWKPLARIGMIANIEITNEIKSNYRLTNLSTSNYVDFLESTSKYKILLELIAFAIKPIVFYRLVLLFRRLFASFWHRKQKITLLVERIIK